MKQSVPTKLLAWLACISGGVGTVAYAIFLCTAIWVRFMHRSHTTSLPIPVYVFGLLGYATAFYAVILSTGIAILRRSRHALLLVIVAGLWSVANLAMSSQFFGLQLTLVTPRIALAALFFMWMILRRKELQKE
jgi:hypothetical protein